MADRRRKPDTTDRAVRRVRAPTAVTRGGDSASRKLSALAGRLGNAGARERLGDSERKADALLGFVVERLRAIRDVQLRERAETREVPRWTKAVDKGVPGYFIPDPTRWHEAARLYRDAARQLAAGRLGRAADLIERAMEAERAALRSAPVQVTEHLQPEQRSVPDAPAELARVRPGEVASPRGLPRDIEIAERILAAGPEILGGTPPRRARRRRWFEEEPEEEAEDDGDEGAR